MTALRVRLSFWQLITRLSYFSLFFFFFYKIKNFFFPLWVNLYMITDTYLHGPPPLNGHFFMTPPFSAVSKSCDPPSVSTPPPPANFWQVPNLVSCQEGIKQSPSRYLHCLLRGSRAWTWWHFMTFQTIDNNLSTLIGHFRVPSGLCIKTRLSA